MRRFDTPLGTVLAALAGAESMVPDREDRAVLMEAAQIVSLLPREARVVITSGDVDPLTAEVLALADDFDSVRDTLAVIEDRLTDVARQLRSGADNGRSTDV